MRFGFFFREALRALKRNAVPSFAAMATVLVTVLILGVFIPMVQATTGAANEVRSKVIADVYLKPNAKQADIDRVRKRDRDADAARRKVEFVSKEQALAREREAGRGAYYDLLGSNPLPDTFRVTPDEPDNIGAVRNALAPASPSGGRTVVDPAIDEVRNREEDTNKILSVTRVVKLTMALLAGLLVARLAAADRQHDPPLAVRAPARGRGDEARRRDRLVHPLAVRARGRDGRRARRRAGGAAARRRQDRRRRPAGGRLRADRRAGHDELRAADRPAAAAPRSPSPRSGSGLSLRRFLRV